MMEMENQTNNQTMIQEVQKLQSELQVLQNEKADALRDLGVLMAEKESLAGKLPFRFHAPPAKPRHTLPPQAELDSLAPL